MTDSVTTPTLHRVASGSQVDATARESLLEQGALVIDRLVDDSVVAELGAVYDDIIANRVAAAGDRELGGLIRQVMYPSREHALFQENPALAAGLAVAEAVFSRSDLSKVYEMLINKPAGTPHATPWHQDVGYFGKPTAPPGTATALEDLQIWLALDDVDLDNGCMQFLPRPHGAPSLRHRVAAGDPDNESRLIEIDEPLDTSGALAAPLAAGGCTVHLVGTPHYTGPNLTLDRARRAYIFNIGPATVKNDLKTSMQAAWGDTARL